MAKTITVSDMDYTDYDAMLADKIKEIGGDITMPQFLRIVMTFYRQRAGSTYQPAVKK